MMYRLCMSALSMRTNPCTSVKSNRRQGNPTFRTKNNEQFIYQYSVAQEINPHHPVQVYSPLTTVGSSRAGSLALVWDPWEHSELGTSNLQHLRFFPAELACSHVADPRRCTDAPIRQRILPSSDPRLGRSKLAVTPGTIVYPAMYNDPWFPCPVRTVVWWYLLSLLYCQQEKQQKYPKDK